jgi:HSF-type DNA-binding
MIELIPALKQTVLAGPEGSKRYETFMNRRTEKSKVNHFMSTPFPHETEGIQSNDESFTRQHVSDSYHDHSLSMPPAGESVSENEDSKRFPDKLFRVLDRAATESFDHVISWQPHGRSFIVHQREAFKELLPLLMPGMTLWLSFQRQLLLWGFTHFTEGRDCNSYYHEHFLRYRPHLLGHMRRIGNSAPCKDNTKTLPDFYSMPFLTPLETDNIDSIHERAATQVAEVVASPWLGSGQESHAVAAAHAGCMGTPASSANGDLGHDSHGAVGANRGLISVVEGSNDQQFGRGSIEAKRTLPGGIVDQHENGSPSDQVTWLGRELEPRLLPPVITLQGEMALCSYTPVPVARHPDFVQIGQANYYKIGAPYHSTGTISRASR